MTREDMKRYGFYLFRWQLSTPILAGALYMFSFLDTLGATIVANLLGGLVFFWVDKLIFAPKRLDVEWEVRESAICADCGREARGYRIARAGAYDRTGDTGPEFRCEECSVRKARALRLKGVRL
jgi:DNA-directed RNA polymerase subunit RPC12/RpoP